MKPTNYPLTYKLRLIRDSRGYINDFQILEWNAPDIEIIEGLKHTTESASYKLFEKQFGFDTTFFDMFVSNIDASTFGKFYFTKKNETESVFKIQYSTEGEIVHVQLSVDDSINIDDFEELNELKYFYENVFFHSSDAIFIVEYRDNEFRYITTNKKHRDETGIPFDAIHNKTPIELVGEEVGQRLIENYTKALNSDDIISYEEFLELPAGPKFWLTQLKKVTIPKMQRILVIGSSKDITELKFKELKNEKLISELEDANAIKNKFFTIIAHDLKNPLFNSQSISDLLHESYDSLSEDEKKEYLKLLKISLKSSSDLLNNLLIWASSQMKGIKVEFEPIYVKKLVDKILEGFEINIKEKKLHVEKENLENAIVYCDSNSLYFIIRNLLSNAIKFSHPNGTIRIAAIQKNSEEVQLSISDQGIGISEIEKEKLFTFLTSSKSGTKGEKGSGLGLVLVKEFVEKNNGKIFFESELNKGSTFSVILPSFKMIKA